MLFFLLVLACATGVVIGKLGRILGLERKAPIKHGPLIKPA